MTKDVPAVVAGSRSRLTQILNNLVANAVKYTDAGSVDVSVEKKGGDGSPFTLLFKVKDTGIGISKEKQAEIFESFIQERDGVSHIYGGTGLGLTISKKLVELQGGCIYLESKQEKGSTFFIEIPFDMVKEKNGRMKSFDITRKSLEGSTVLLVEDNVVNQKVMLRFLEKWDVNVIIAEDGGQALSKIKSNSVHLVLMDLQMPVMDGYEAARKIRRLGDKQKSTLPIIALTAAALQEVKEKVFATGMDDYLAKPFNPNELQAKLEHYILNRQ